MYISSLLLHGFRSHIEADFEFSEGVNIVLGPNASGKTNLLEALLVLSRGASYRAEFGSLINYNSESAKISAMVNNTERQILIKQSDNSTTRELTIEGVKKSRWTQRETLPVVLFEPGHLDLINGRPSLRRAYLDELSDQVKPGYKSTRQRYQRVLAQRNRLLKTNHKDSEMFAWDVKLCEYAEQIVKQRIELINKLNELLPKYYSEIAGDNKKAQVVYGTDIDTDNYLTAMLKKLHINKQTDIQRGFTCVGPHRDDVVFILNQKPAPESASRGESRSLVLSAKLTESKILENIFSTPALFLLDDVFSELDTSRQKSLARILNKTQTVLTTTNADTWVQFKNTHFETIRLGTSNL